MLAVQCTTHHPRRLGTFTMTAEIKTYRSAHVSTRDTAGCKNMFFFFSPARGIIANPYNQHLRAAENSHGIIL